CQKNILPNLISALNNIHKHNLPQFVQRVGFDFRQSIRLILGETGTGKTHGLTNCVETHLKHDSPAIIIRAKGTPVRKWTEILSASLQLNQWNKNEILSALETLAIRTDVALANKIDANYDGKTKVLICVDGLEEDIDNGKESLRSKRLKAGWNKEYLIDLLK
ncbi:hypothetical protein EZS27_043694, partial [termite gut metagenome]